ncbi:MAG: bifunctional pyr operon transcriptional regulator/uracil phosphoribosyltransferase PyrR [candidate division WOR-3 bacterium]|jgi:pyrimidine operon attenuation protein/uracil phosphoribosyltransferase
MKRRLLSAEEIAHIIHRLSEEVAQKNPDIEQLVLVGIQRRGVPLAARLARKLSGRTGTEPPVGSIDITLYRDDLQLIAETPLVRGSSINFDINGRRVVLVDDVIFTGRTARAALTELLDFGRPQVVQLLVLVDRGHRELPIQPDFTGLRIETERNDLVDIFLSEVDGRDEVLITRRSGGG